MSNKPSLKFKKVIWQLTPTESAIAELLDEGYSSTTIRKVLGIDPSRVIHKMRELKHANECMRSSASGSSLKTARGNKMDPFVR